MRGTSEWAGLRRGTQYEGTAVFQLGHQKRINELTENGTKLVTLVVKYLETATNDEKTFEYTDCDFYNSSPTHDMESTDNTVTYNVNAKHSYIDGIAQDPEIVTG